MKVSPTAVSGNVRVLVRLTEIKQDIGSNTMPSDANVAQKKSKGESKGKRGTRRARNNNGDSSGPVVLGKADWMFILGNKSSSVKARDLAGNQYVQEILLKGL